MPSIMLKLTKCYIAKTNWFGDISLDWCIIYHPELTSFISFRCTSQALSPKKRSVLRTRRIMRSSLPMSLFAGAYLEGGSWGRV